MDNKKILIHLFCALAFSYFKKYILLILMYKECVDGQNMGNI